MKLALSAKNSMVDMANEEFPEALGLAQALQASQIGPAADGTLNFDLALPRDVMESFLREACTRVQETDVEDEEIFVEPDDASVLEAEPNESLRRSFNHAPVDRLPAPGIMRRQTLSHLQPNANTRETSPDAPQLNQEDMPLEPSRHQPEKCALGRVHQRLLSQGNPM